MCRYKQKRKPAKQDCFCIVTPGVDGICERSEIIPIAIIALFILQLIKNSKALNLILTYGVKGIWERSELIPIAISVSFVIKKRYDLIPKLVNSVSLFSW
jgi:hypothetical protein